MRRRMMGIMKIHNILMVVMMAAATVGCGRSTSYVFWEYKIITVENNEHAQESSDAMKLISGTNSDASGVLKDLQYDTTISGDFDLETKVNWNSLEQDRWELAAAIPQTETESTKDLDGNVYANVRTGKVILIFKRPVE